MATSAGRKKLLVCASVVLYWAMVSLLPVYNKAVFAMFPYPVATTVTQIGAATGILFFWIEAHAFFRNRAYRLRSTGRLPLLDTGAPAAGHRRRYSSMCGPGFFYKAYVCLPTGVLFGLKYSVTNIGLHVLPTATHILLQATDIVWTVLAARVVNQEHLVSVADWVACLLSLVGSTCLTVDLETTYKRPGALAWPIIVNFTSPALLGVCLATLRRATVKLTELSVAEEYGEVSSAEITWFKLFFSGLTSGVIAVCIEGPLVGEGQPFWEVLHALGPTAVLSVVGGAVIITVYQTNCTWLTRATSTLTVGIVSGMKIVPQWIWAATFNGTPGFENPLATVGIISIIGSGVLWSASRGGLMQDEPKALLRYPQHRLPPAGTGGRWKGLRSQVLIKHLQERASSSQVGLLNGSEPSSCLEYAAASFMRLHTMNRMRRKSGSDSPCPLPPVQEESTSRPGSPSVEA